MSRNPPTYFNVKLLQNPNSNPVKQINLCAECRYKGRLKTEIFFSRI